MARKTPAILVLTLSMVCLGVRAAAGAIIPVTTTEQKIDGLGECSLQEAIFSANFDNNVAIARYNGSTPIEVVTQCVPGSGDDIIVLPLGALMLFNRIVDDAYNPTGPTATPLITSNITILAYGATFQRSSGNFRLFAVGNTGHLTIRRAFIRGFKAQGGSGGLGGGGGLGAGGAIFVMGGTLVIEGSTFEGNSAYGGLGGVGLGGGGGGIGGSGGSPLSSFCSVNSTAGGGGGGARGDGGRCGSPDPLEGGGGGGTISHARNTRGGFDCGGNGGYAGNGQNAPCPGGGGGGAGDTLFLLPGEDGFDGGKGHYGGGGGGGTLKGDGGRGGFGGGGGASGYAPFFGESGGDGGFGGGGGAGNDGAITDGDGGNGGFFAGDGGSRGGGGGAGLGGAIFNEGGTVDVRNSTFSGNTTSGGLSERNQDGISGGGAIFSVNGHLTVLNSTISGGLARVGGGILVVQHEETKPTSFVLENTLIANNAAGECAITGFNMSVAFAGNLIMSNGDGSEFDGRTFVGCGGVVSSSDPQLGPLAYNEGSTPTMAIGSTSPAWNAADPGSSLPVDQRRQHRPAMGGFDIGAFELCLEGIGKLQAPCPIIVGIEDPGGGNNAAQLTVEVSPPGAGTTTPAPGTQALPLNSVVPLAATPNTGFRFTGWSPNVTNPADASTTIVMNASQTVTANFAPCECPVDVTSSLGITYGGVTLNPMTRRYVQTVTLKNNSAVTVVGPISLVLDKLSPNVTVYNSSGTTALVLPAGSPYMNANTNLAPGQSVALQLQFINTGNIVFSYDARVLAGPGSR